METNPQPGAQPSTPQPAAAVPMAAPEAPVPAEHRTWAVAAHLSGFIGFIGIPFGNIAGPLIIWLLKRDEMPFVADQAREALNFQISVTIYAAVAGVLIFVLIGLLLLPAVIVTAVVFMVLAAIKSNAGEYYRYPLTIRLVT